MGKRSRRRMTGLSEGQRVKRSEKQKVEEEERRKVARQRMIEAILRIKTR